MPDDTQPGGEPGDDTTGDDAPGAKGARPARSRRKNAGEPAAADRADDAGDDAAEADEPITPEVVQPAGAAYVRRGMGAVRMASIGLALFGVLFVVQSAPLWLDPPARVCDFSRVVLDREIDRVDGELEEDDEDDPSEALVAARAQSVEGLETKDDVDDLSCDDANARALIVDEADDDFSRPSEDVFRTFGLVLTAISLLQAVGGVLLLRRQTKQIRWVAIAGAVLGVFESQYVGLGILGMLVFIAILYGLVYSADARATFGHPGGRPPRPRPAGGGLFAPRPRPGTSTDTEGTET